MTTNPRKLKMQSFHYLQLFFGIICSFVTLFIITNCLLKYTADDSFSKLDYVDILTNNIPYPEITICITKPEDEKQQENGTLFEDLMLSNNKEEIRTQVWAIALGGKRLKKMIKLFDTKMNKGGFLRCFTSDSSKLNVTITNLYLR